MTGAPIGTRISNGPALGDELALSILQVALDVLVGLGLLRFWYSCLVERESFEFFGVGGVIQRSRRRIAVLDVVLELEHCGTITSHIVRGARARRER